MAAMRHLVTAAAILILFAGGSPGRAQSTGPAYVVTYI
jgi:hypothetical protein